ncbi:MAG: hypothetical protein F6K61_08610 [Sphaerospermopsis sp. SIO1G1]|nr:hypothetical protein [Sphaerospermopsis sp. SIO1G1]
MKPGLKRIEATLHDLCINKSQSSSETHEGTKRPFSFRISVDANKRQETSQSAQNRDINTTDPSTQNSDQSQHNHNSKNNSVQSFSAQVDSTTTPNLPKFKTPTFSNHRHGANPAFAMTLLQEIQTTVASWQTELQAIVQQIQDIYLEGPVINGWLESSTAPEQDVPGTATLRHAEVEQLMNYVQEICNAEKVSHSSSRTGYRLCGIDAAGKVWSRPCPINDVPSVSMSIARHQKLRQLLNRKQYLENRLGNLAEHLVNLHSDIQHP